MGAYSTLFITRADALKVISSKLEKATDEELGDMLCALLKEKTLHNFWVADSVPDKLGEIPKYQDGEFDGL